MARLQILFYFCFAGLLFAQGNYEVQVYGSDTVAPWATMVELHSNFTAIGSKTMTDRTYPTNHQEHETVEITQGWNDWFETGFYIFTNIGPSRKGEHNFTRKVAGGFEYYGVTGPITGFDPIGRSSTDQNDSRSPVRFLWKAAVPTLTNLWRRYDAR